MAVNGAPNRVRERGTKSKILDTNITTLTKTIVPRETARLNGGQVRRIAVAVVTEVRVEVEVEVVLDESRRKMKLPIQAIKML